MTSSTSRFSVSSSRYCTCRLAGMRPMTRSASVAPLGRVHHAAHEQQCAGRRVLDGPREGPVEDQVEGVRAASRRSRIVTAVVAAARVPASSTSTRARCRTRLSALSPGPVDQLVEVAAGLEAGRPEQLVELERALGGEARAARRCPARAPTRRRATRRASPRSAGRARRTAAGSRPRRARSAPRRSSSSTSPAPSNGAGRVSSNGCCHFASRYSASVITAISSSLRVLEDARDHPVRLLVRPRVDRGPGRAGRCRA